MQTVSVNNRIVISGITSARFANLITQRLNDTFGLYSFSAEWMDAGKYGMRINVCNHNGTPLAIEEDLFQRVKAYAMGFHAALRAHCSI